MTLEKNTGKHAHDFHAVLVLKHGYVHERLNRWNCSEYAVNAVLCPTSCKHVYTLTRCFSEKLGGGLKLIISLWAEIETGRNFVKSLSVSTTTCNSMYMCLLHGSV